MCAAWFLLDDYLSAIQENQRKAIMESFRAAEKYCYLSTCRRKFLLEYFGEAAAKDCGTLYQSFFFHLKIFTCWSFAPRKLSEYNACLLLFFGRCSSFYCVSWVHVTFLSVGCLTLHVWWLSYFSQLSNTSCGYIFNCYMGVQRFVFHLQVIVIIALGLERKETCQEKPTCCCLVYDLVVVDGDLICLLMFCVDPEYIFLSIITFSLVIN